MRHIWPRIADPPDCPSSQCAAKTDKPAKTVEPAKQAIEIINVTIHPAAEPVPALKYHLLPTFLETTPGDAMPMYAKANGRICGHLDTHLR